MKKKPASVAERFSQLKPSQLVTSSIVISELMYGAEKSKYSEKSKQAIENIASILTVLPYDNQASAHYAEIRTELENNGTPIDAMNLLIAAHTRSLSFTLVTNNTKEFERVPSLKTDNWV